MECFFCGITSAPDLIAVMDEYSAHHHPNPKPFIWAKSAADILQKFIPANRYLSAKQKAKRPLQLPAQLINIPSVSTKYAKNEK